MCLAVCRATFSTSPASCPADTLWSFYATLTKLTTTSQTTSITGISLSKNTFTCGLAGAVGAIGVQGTGNSGGVTLSLSGPAASLFSLSSRTAPSNLTVGSFVAGCPNSYSINIVGTLAGATGSPYTQAETIAGKVSSTDFSTTFPATENPISQNGRWTNGGTTGIDWGNVETVGGSPGKAYGVSQPSAYADPTAILSGVKLNNDQQASATLFVTGTPAVGEVEVRLRTNISAHSITGYELYCSVTASDPYVAITKWEGPLNRWYNLLQYKGSPYACTNGTVLKGTVQGNPPVLTLYLNGVKKAQATDTGQDGFPVWTSGYAGIGFWGGNPFSAFGFSNFSASNYP